MISLQLPHWLIIGGAALVAAGSIGLALRKTKAVEKEIPDEPVKPREPMPPLPTLLNSNRKRREEKTEPLP
jgi:hypothetical protein